MTHLPAFSTLVLLLSLVLIIGCDDGLPEDPFANLPSALNVDASTGYSSLDVSTARTNFNNFPFERLSNQEVKGIQFLREEEKVAVDYYEAMDALFDSDIMNRVAQSERTHFAISGLPIDKYSLVDPTDGMPSGAFTSQSLQAHYNELITEGTPSFMAAWMTGALLQEANLITIENQLNRVANNRDLRNIYEELRIATRNHLRIMIQQLNSNGGSYSAMFLEPSVLEEIMRIGFEGG